MTDPVESRLRAAGCVFAEQEAALLREAAGPDLDADTGPDTGPDTGLDALVARRAAGEPLETIVGWVAFGGRRFPVAAGVFVPRRRSEALVAAAVQHAPKRERLVVVDLCCGAGAVGASVADGLGTGAGGREGRGARVELVAVDGDRRAVAAARAACPDATVLLGDLDTALPQRLLGRVDVLVAVPPYVPTAEIVTMPREARDHEPHRALDGGADGLDVARRIVGAAGRWLAADGVLGIEVGAHQADALTAELAVCGFRGWVEYDEERDATVVLGARVG